MRSLDRQLLQGLWAAIATPWDHAGNIDSGVLTENCSRLASAKVDGMYTTDADGEFYAIEHDQFKQLSQAFAKAVEPTGVDAAIGVSWFNTAGVIERTRIAVDAGICNVHVALPFFMPLADSDVDRFFDDRATAVPDARWIYYDYARSLPDLTGRHYARLAARYPQQFIGAKIAAVGGDLTRLTDLLSAAIPFVFKREMHRWHRPVYSVHGAIAVTGPT